MSDGSFDFDRLESELRQDNLASNERAEMLTFTWSFSTLACGVSDMIIGAQLLADQSPKKLGLFVVSAVATAFSFRRAIKNSRELRDMPFI